MLKTIYKIELLSIKLTDHDSSWDGIPLEPERNKGARYQDYSWDKDSSEIEGPVSRKDEVYFQTAVVT